MKKKCLFIVVFALFFYWAANGTLVHAQKAPKTLTLLYSNNINGEIDSCPT